MVKTLIITSCTGEKKHKPENQLYQNDFYDKKALSHKEQELSEYREKASDLYTGMQHLRLMEGINELRKTFDQHIVDLSIISAGYGLLNEDEIIVPYEVTFNDMNNSQIVEWSNHLQIPQNVSQLIKSYDLVFFLLGDKYLRSLQLPFDGVNENQKLIFLASKTSEKIIPKNKPYYFLEVGQNDAKEFSYGLVGLKGFLFKQLAKEIMNYGKDLFEEIYENPKIVMERLEKYRKKEQNLEQLSFFTETKEAKPKKVESKKKEVSQLKQRDFNLTEDQYAKNYGVHKLKFFMPENDDRVDPNFNFITDEHTKDRDPIFDDVYAHEIYDTPNYDGVLISKMNIEKSTTRKDQILNAGGLHKFLRLPNHIPLYGDCGAFSYIQEEKPPFQTEEILNYYKEMGFDIGTSIDHLIIGKIAENKEKRKFRYELTLKNAHDFIQKHKEGHYTFTPSGIAQGWDVESYRNCFAELINMGYRHISLGGLALAQSEEILAILHGIAPIVPEYLEIHLLGAARLEYLDVFHKLGVTSFDSTTFLKKAWGGATGGNYFTQDKNKYAAIRIPQADEKKNTRIKEFINRDIDTIDGFITLEQNSLGNVREFDKGNTDLNTTVETVLQYDSYFETLKDYNQKYKKEKAIRDKYVCEKLGLSQPELVQIEKDILVILNKFMKKNELKGMHEFIWRDSSFNLFMSKNDSILKSSGDGLLQLVKEEAVNRLKKALKKKKSEDELELKIEELEEGKLEKLISMSKFLIGDLSFKSLISKSENLSKEVLDNLIFNQFEKLKLADYEAIKENNLSLLETTLKDFFTENYDRIYSSNKLRPLYHQVLTDQPWKSCSCSVCKGVGVEVIIFRGNNRNRRRGFHNTYVFYNQVKEIVK